MVVLVVVPDKHLVEGVIAVKGELDPMVTRNRTPAWVLVVAIVVTAQPHGPAGRQWVGIRRRPGCRLCGVQIVRVKPAGRIYPATVDDMDRLSRGLYARSLDPHVAGRVPAFAGIPDEPPGLARRHGTADGDDTDARYSGGLDSHHEVFSCGSDSGAPGGPDPTKASAQALRESSLLGPGQSVVGDDRDGPKSGPWVRNRRPSGKARTPVGPCAGYGSIAAGSRPSSFSNILWGYSTLPLYVWAAG